MIFAMVGVAILLMAFLILLLAALYKSVSMFWGALNPKDVVSQEQLSNIDVDESCRSSEREQVRKDSIEALAHVGISGTSVDFYVDEAMGACPKCSVQGIVNIVVQMRGSVTDGE